MAASTSKLSDPAWRVERARKAAAARHSLDTYVKTIVDRAPELTPEQRARLAVLLAPAHAEGKVADTPIAPTPPPRKPQLVTIGKYAYAWKGDEPLKVGDRVLLPSNWLRTTPFEGVVTALGSTWNGEHATILKKLA